jgi:LPXTG-motif cell wall-anchored protein
LKRTLQLLGATALVTAALWSGGTAAYAWGNVTICHATDSSTNPYVKQTVAVDSLDNGHGVHGVNAGDIIPPFDGKSGHYPGNNWNYFTAYIWQHDCTSPQTTTTTVAPTTSTTEPQTSTTTEEPTSTTVPSSDTTVQPTTSSTADQSSTTSSTFENIGTPANFSSGNGDSGVLPFTGAASTVLTLIGIALLTVGAFMASRRRR